MQLLGTAFTGCTLQAVDGPVGEVADLLFEEKSWNLRWLEVYCGPWLKGRRILIAPSALERPDPQGWALTTKLTRAQIRNSPVIEADGPISLEMDRTMACYYGCNPLLPGGCPANTPGSPQAKMPGFQQSALMRTVAARNRLDQPEPHLRSVVELEGYAVVSADNAAGFLHNVAIDDEAWTICFLVIDMPKWWFGKHVVVPACCAGAISWCHRCIQLDLTHDKLQESPVLHPPGPADTAFQALLRACGGWRGRGPASSQST